jgi:hypothetical protein
VTAAVSPALHAQRGSTLPLALGGIVAMLAFAFFALNYANTLRWQIRAQSAADAAAQAMLAVQTQQFNEMNAALYATAVEEYRLRHTLNAMVEASHGIGGCDYRNPQSGAGLPGCATVEATLETEYNASLARYSADLLTLHQITATLDYDHLTADMNAVMTQIRSTSSPVSGDPAFTYGTPIIQERTDTEAVSMDGDAVLKPSPGHGTTSAAGTLNENLFAPIEVETYACTQVPSIFPSFLSWIFPPFTAVARGAATPVMVEEDWLQPGSIPNPFTNKPYQQPEAALGTTTLTDPSSGYDWYDLNFGGNGAIAIANEGFSYGVTTDEFSVFIGWWNAIPIHAFGPAKSAAAMGCTS